MSQSQLFAFVKGYFSCSGRDVADLTTVDVVLRQLFYPSLEFGEICLLASFLHHFKEVLPHLAAGILIERWIVKGELNAGLECFVDGSHAVTGQKQYTIEVFQSL